MTERTPEQAGAFDGLLQESRDLARARLSNALRAMLDKADEALTALSSQTRERELQDLYRDTRKLLATERGKLAAEFEKFYVLEFDNRSLVVKDPGHTFSQLVTSTLRLVGDDDLQETLTFKEMAAKLRRYCDEELVALDQRVGVLLGDANLSAEVNPLSPQAICDAYQQACHELDTTLKVRGVLLKLFDDHVLDEVRSIYKDVNALLVKNSILPKIRYGVAKKPDAKPAGAPVPAVERKAEAAQADAALAAPPDANVFALLQKLVPARADAGTGAGTGALQGAELLGSLTSLQQSPAGAPAGAANVLHGLKTSEVGAGMAQMDAMTLDIVAMLFDQLFDDPKIPIGLKGLIGRLQIPMLKVAIADKSFFSKKTHPARQALDTLGEIALRLPPDFSAKSRLFAEIEEIVQQVLDGFREDMGIFESMTTQLRGIIADEDKRVEAETRSVAERAAQAEALAVAKSAAEDEVRARVQANKLPGAVLEFLVEHWMKLLLLVHAKAGVASNGWKDALEVMDQLVWSVQPKTAPEERRKMAAAVPGLVKNIASGLHALGASDAVRAAFFAELMKVHTEILVGQSKAKAAGAPPEPPRKPAAAPDFSAPVTVRNPYGGGDVQVAGLERSDSYQDLTVGTWVDFRPKAGQEKARAAKVLFVTPKKTRYVFSDRNGKNMVELTRGELARRLRTGEAVRLPQAPEEPLFDRIMGGLVQKLKSPAARAA